MNTFILESNIQIDYNRAVGMETTPWSNVIPRPTDANGISITGIAAAVAKVTGGASGGTATVSLYWITKAIGENNIVDYDYVKANGTLIGDVAISANVDDTLYNIVEYSEELADITEQCYLVATVDIVDTIIIEGLVFSVQYVDQDLMAHVDDSDNPHSTKIVNLADVNIPDIANSAGQRLVVNENGDGFEVAESSGVGIASAKYKFNTDTTGVDPTNGHCSVNAAGDVAFISKLDINGSDKTAGLGYPNVGDYIGYEDRNSPDHLRFKVLAAGVDEGDYFSYSVSKTSELGTLNNNENIYVELLIIGAKKFKGLLDTPSDYTGNSGKVVAVNTAEDGLEFVNGGGGSDTHLLSVKYYVNGSLPATTILSRNTGSTIDLGFYIPDNGDYKITGIVALCGSFGTNQASNAKIRIAHFTSPNAAQYAYGAGVTLYQDTIFSTTGSSATQFYGSTFTDLSAAPLELPTGKMIMVDFDKNFFDVTDLSIDLIIRRD